MMHALEYPTPLRRAETLSGPDSPTYLKLECELPTGSFKVRGAIHALTRRRAASNVREVVAASTGNHGAAVAYAARLAAIPATIFVPRDANPVKLERIRKLGATLRESGDLLAEAIDAAEAHARETGAYFLHDAADPDVPVGAGAIAHEILEQAPDVDRIYVPMGDTALIRGVSAEAKRRSPKVRIIGVQSENAPAYYRSWKSGEVVVTETASTIADGLATTRPLAANVARIRELVDDVVLVSEDELLDAIGALLLREHVVAEPAGAAATAAFRKQPPSTGVAVLLVTGGNIAPDILERAVARTGCGSGA
jgi:threonine dehydratase